MCTGGRGILRSWFATTLNDHHTFAWSSAMPDVQPLAGLKVIDFTRYLAGPFCTQTLGDYGAEVLKVEPVEGARGEMGGGSAKDSYFFLSTNRSKKSIQVSTRKPEGRAVLQRMLDT